ncbi:MAG: hypothetical protein LUQ44_04790 [Methanothrix sp.]|nr:hypothetical protein [Methanothrix sp.]
MNQKAFAIFVGAIMIVSAFAGFVLMGGNQSGTIAVAGSPSVETFGVQGRVVDWSFDSLAETLEMSPESTVMAYWINLSASQNLTDAARAILPQSFALSYGDQLYPTKIEKLAVAYFNKTWVEFHGIRPFPVSHSGLVIPYENYMMIPTSSEYVAVMGKPTLFGLQDSLKSVIDVISGGFPTDKFTLAKGEQADMQLVALGRGASGSLLPGGYKEFYLGLSSAKNIGNNSFNVTARYLQPDSSADQKARTIASEYGLAYSNTGSLADVSGQVQANDLQGLLAAFLSP